MSAIREELMTTIVQLVQGLNTQDGAGVKLKRVIGQPLLPRLDPFLMLDEFGSDEPQDYISGFPAHPHRGFQTVTYMLEGCMGHRDSVGNHGVIRDGGLQWMNAGYGIIHEELPQQTEGRLRGFQLWVNLPASDKLSPPNYRDIPSEDIPEVDLNGGKIRVLAGQFKQVKGAINGHALEPEFWDVHLTEKQTFIADTNPMHNAFIYVYEGELDIAGTSVTKGVCARLNLSAKISISVASMCRFIFVSGQPINEPVVQYGPFVMNTKEEIQRAVMDYQNGRLTEAVIK